MSKTFDTMKSMWKEQNIERFGQWFMNRYYKGQWPELFYADEKLSALLIQQWLTDFQYTDEMPPIVR